MYVHTNANYKAVLMRLGKSFRLPTLQQTRGRGFVAELKQWYALYTHMHIYMYHTCTHELLQ